MDVHHVFPACRLATESHRSSMQAGHRAEGKVRRQTRTRSRESSAAERMRGHRGTCAATRRRGCWPLGATWAGLSQRASTWRRVPSRYWRPSTSTATRSAGRAGWSRRYQSTVRTEAQPSRRWRIDAAQRSAAPLSALRPLRTTAAEPAGSADRCGVVQRRPVQSMPCRLQAAGWTQTRQPPNPLLRCRSLVRIAAWFSTPACARGAHLACR